MEGVLSDSILLMDTVFQDIVLGPALWSTFFSHVAGPATAHGASEQFFADDVSASKQYNLGTPNADLIADMERTRSSVHKWGKRNRVVFEATKENLVILHPQYGEGEGG